MILRYLVLEHIDRVPRGSLLWHSIHDTRFFHKTDNLAKIMKKSLNRTSICNG